jgi:hypothetical protein
VKDLLAALARGELKDELQIVRALRSPYCPVAFVEAVAANSWATSRKRVLVALVRHPHCPRALVWRALPQLGWHDLLLVVEDPRAPMPVRRQAEHKLLERLPLLSLGEKVALSRKATPLLFNQLMQEEEPRVLAALLENPKFSLEHCLRLVAQASSPWILGQVLRHGRWGDLLPVRQAALANPLLPVPWVLSLLVSLPDSELHRVSQAQDLPTKVRELASQALWARSLRSSGEPDYLH